MKQAYVRTLLSFFGFALIGANGAATGVILPSLSSYYGVDNSVIGLLFLASSSGYFLSALGSGPLLERLGLRRFLMVGVFTFLLGTLTLAIRPPFGVVLATRLFLGLGVAIIETGLNAYVVALPRHTTQLNTLHAFYGAGALVGPLVASVFLAINWPWNSVYLVWTVLSLPLLLGIPFTFSALAPRHAGQEGAQVDKTAEEGAKTGNALLAALKLPIVWLAAIFLLLYVGIEVSLGNWTYTFLVGGLHQPQVLAGWIVSGYWLGLTLGRFTLSKIAQRVRLSEVGLVYACIGGVCLGVLLVWFLPTDLFAAIGFCLLGYSLGPIYPTTVALAPRLVASRLVSSTIGFLVSLSILGIAIFPWLAGILAQYRGIWTLLPYTGALGLGMLLFWWIIFVARGKSTEQDQHSSP